MLLMPSEYSYEQEMQFKYNFDRNKDRLISFAATSSQKKKMEEDGFDSKEQLLFDAASVNESQFEDFSNMFITKTGKHTPKRVRALSPSVISGNTTEINDFASCIDDSHGVNKY